jgi:hypothetical protein
MADVRCRIHSSEAPVAEQTGPFVRNDKIILLSFHSLWQYRTSHTCASWEILRWLQRFAFSSVSATGNLSIFMLFRNENFARNLFSRQ